MGKDIGLDQEDARRREGSRGKAIAKGLLLLVTVALVLGTLLGRFLVGQVQPSELEPSPGRTVGTVAQERLVPTTVWMNLYSPESLLDGQPLPVGAVVRAYDPQGVLCGEFVVAQLGKYGLMPIYADDPGTPWDEGAVPGDRIELRVDGRR